MSHNIYAEILTTMVSGIGMGTVASIVFYGLRDDQRAEARALVARLHAQLRKPDAFNEQNTTQESK